MCKGVWYKNTKWRKNCKNNYFLFVLAVAVAANAPSSETIITHYCSELPGIKVVPSDASVFGLFCNSIMNFCSSIVHCMLLLEVSRYVK